MALTAGIGRLRAVLRSAIADRLVAPPKLTIAEWADRYRFLSREASAEPGKWSTARAPYQRGIMDAVSDPLIPEVVVMSSAQVGKTEIVLNTVGYFADQDPAPVMVIQPTLDMGKAWSKDRLEPMIRDTPRIKEKFPPPKTRSPDNAILHKKFPGGHLTIVGANSAASLASRPIRVVAADEVDRYPPSAGSEGDPVALAAKRQTNFWNRKTLRTSTPTVKDASRIEKDYNASDQRKYWVPCPRCGEFQVLLWKGLVWESHDPETVRYACEHCGALLEEADKQHMLDHGEWRAEAPFRGIAGFWLNALYSPWAYWSELVEEWLRAQGDPEALRVFINTVLAEVWEEKGESVAADPLLERREEYAEECPAGVGMLTMGVDVQADRLEALVVGWGAGEESWVVAYETLRGDTSRQEVWDDLERVRRRKWGGLPIQAVGVDSGYRTDEVYRFVGPRQGQRVWAFKGVAGTGKAVTGKPTKPNKSGVRVYPIGVESAKDTLFARLRTSLPGSGYIHFPTWLEPEFFTQLTAETVIIKRVRGHGVRTYVKRPGARNEAIDLLVYAFAALVGLGDTARRSLGNLARKRLPNPAPSAPKEGEKPESPAVERIRRALAPKRRKPFATSF